MRPPLVWIIEMALGWNVFDWYNFASVFVLAMGMSVHLLVPPLDRLKCSRFLLRREVTFCGLLTPLDPDEPEEDRELEMTSKYASHITSGGSPFLVEEKST